jgi:hypothetical protein
MAASAQEKALCVLEFAKTTSVSSVQRHFRTRCGKNPPARKSIYNWYKQFQGKGCLQGKEHRASSGLRGDCSEFGKRSIAVRRRVLQKRLCMKPYQLQLLHDLKANDKVNRYDFCYEMQKRLEDDGFAKKLIFSDETTFNTSGKVNRHNVHVWGSENPQVACEHELDSPKVNVFCAISNKKVSGPFFLIENSHWDVLSGYGLDRK